MALIGYLASSSDYGLQNSFILDSRATVHICNSYQYFATFTPASKDDLLYTRNMVVLIKDFSAVDIIIQILASLRLIEL